MTERQPLSLKGRRAKHMWPRLWKMVCAWTFVTEHHHRRRVGYIIFYTSLEFLAPALARRRPNFTAILMHSKQHECACSHRDTSSHWRRKTSRWQVLPPGTPEKWLLIQAPEPHELATCSSRLLQLIPSLRGRCKMAKRTCAAEPGAHQAREGPAWQVEQTANSHARLQRLKRSTPVRPQMLGHKAA